MIWTGLLIGMTCKHRLELLAKEKKKPTFEMIVSIILEKL